MRIGGAFFDKYFSIGMNRVLEVGSLDVNGSLRKWKPADVEWIGVDIEPGKGVDVIVQPHERLPFPDDHFDLVVATSVFEHDTAFWKTMAEIARVANDGAYIYISAPSNGPIHRYPLDVFRFYPDAGISLVKIAQESGKPGAFLSESFVADQDHEGMWNDFVAVIGAGSKCFSPRGKIFEVEQSANVWNDGSFLDSTSSFIPEDQSKRDSLLVERDSLLSSLSWRVTRPIRKLVSLLPGR
jgi:SAM-dependent methyltransferase